MKKAVFLFDKTGIMAQPWARAGYLCYCFDGQHPEGVTLGDEPLVLNVGMWFDGETDVERIVKVVGPSAEFVFGFPECTHLAVSGAAHFAKKRAADPLFQDKAMALVRMVENVGNAYSCPWAIENPVSVISSMWRRPDFTFDPFEFGGFLPEGDVHPSYPEYIKPRDAYPKKTCIWAGGGFIEPEKRPVPVDAGYSDQHNRLGGKSLRTKNIRSATPRGFALATFHANAGGANP
jgi:hypothetical protein